MFHLKFLKLYLVLTLVAFIFSSCQKEDFAPLDPSENLAFSSNYGNNYCPVPSKTAGGDKTFYKFKMNNGKTNWANSDRSFWLGILADEKVREIYIFAEERHCSWQRVDPKSGSDGFKKSFDPDAYLRFRKHAGLFNSKKEDLKAFPHNNNIYVVFGKKYGILQIDQGGIFREGGFGNLPSDIVSVDLLPFTKTHDFKNKCVFLGVKKDGQLAGCERIDGPYRVPDHKRKEDVNHKENIKKTHKNVKKVKVTGHDKVQLTLKDNRKVTAIAKSAADEFLSVQH